MNMNKIDNLIRLDERNQKQRQKQLYENNLVFDQNRSIYQHPINIANFLGNQEVFNEAARNLEGGLPQSQIKQQIVKYNQTQRQIQNLEQGYVNQLEREEVLKTLEQLKKLIQQINKEIERIEAENLNQTKENTATREQVENYNANVRDNIGYLDMQESNEGQLKQRIQYFNQVKENIKVKENDLKQDYQRQYRTVLFEKQRLAKLESQFKDRSNEAYQLQSEISVVHKLGFALEDQVDYIKQQLAKQKRITKQQNNPTSSQISNVNYATSEVDVSPTASRLREYEVSQNLTAKNVKPVIYIAEQGSTCWFLFILILATILLALWTGRQAL